VKRKRKAENRELNRSYEKAPRKRGLDGPYLSYPNNKMRSLGCVVECLSGVSAFEVAPFTIYALNHKKTALMRPVHKRDLSY